MKISLSALACDEAEQAAIYSAVKNFGFDGVEITGMKTPEKGKVCCIASEVCLSKLTDSDLFDEYAKLANKLGTTYISVFACDDAGESFIIDSLKKLSVKAEEYNVTLLIETSGPCSATKRLAKILSAVGNRKIAALWDSRKTGDKPTDVILNLGTYIKFVRLGKMNMPLDDIADALHSINYDGYVSYAPCYIEEDVSVFADAMKPFRTKHKHPSQDNNTRTGKYVWPKERLLEYTFPDVLDRMCEQFPNQYAFRYTELDYFRTYPEFRDDVDRFARSLLAMGVKKGDHVAIWATNVPQWFITFWAATKIGAVLVTVNTAYRIHEIEYLLKQSDTHTLVMLENFKDIDYIGIVRKLCPELDTCEKGKLNAERLPYLRNVVITSGEHHGCYTWDEAMKKADEVPYTAVEKIRRTIDMHDVANMQYTSGTTGFPKGVMLTHYNVVNNGKAIGDCMDLSTADKMMIQVPMFHCFGMVLAMTASMTHGTTMCPITAFSPRKGLACINKEQITCFHGVPTMFIAMLGHEDFEKTDFSHMRTGIMAGSPCPIKTMQDVIDKMHMKEICITYGQTEASPATTMSKTTDSIETRVNTVGGPIFGVECKIVDPATNKELPDNVDGEFVARGYNIMKGYYKMPEATAAAIDSEGWLHTGDLARRTPEGQYKITGRIKDVIIRGGENIYPKEIEDFLYTHPKIKDVQAIGVPDKAYGEEIMACVILKEGETATEDEIRNYVKENMAKHKVPRYVDFVTEFPMNAAGKILKYKMREAAIEKLGLQDASKIVTA